MGDKDIDGALSGAFMDDHGSKFVTYETAVNEAKNMAPMIAVLKALIVKLPESTQPNSCTKTSRKIKAVTASDVPSGGARKVPKNMPRLSMNSPVAKPSPSAVAIGYIADLKCTRQWR